VWTEYLRLGLTAALAVVLGIAVFTTKPTNSEEETPRGRLLFVGTGCGGCHRIGDNTPSIEIGPSLIGLSDRAGDRVPGLSASEYVAQSIREPQAFTVRGYEAGVMPTFPLTAAEVDSLVEYLLSGA
jgi:mono/diheme cytochrome c family protein